MTDTRPETDERELAARALDGDEEALGHLLALHQAWAYNLAYRVLGHEADARDAVQDAFLQTVRSLRGEGAPPRSADGFKPWLRRVVTNAAVTQIRRRGAHTAQVDAVADSLPGPASGEPDHAVEQVETRGQILQVLLGLPETQRVALALREYLDASYDEIAEALDLSRTAIGTLLFRARAAFRSSYDRVAASTRPADCPDVVPLFASIVDGEPRPGNWLTLEAHLKSCEACGGELESQRRARRMYALVPLLALPAGWEPVKAVLGGLAAGASSGAAAGQAASGMSAGADAAHAGTSAGATAGQAVAGQAAVGAAAGSPTAAAPVAASTGTLAGSASATAPTAATAAGAAGAPLAASGGLASGGGLAGIATAATGAKLTLAALATAAVVGVGVVAAPFVGTNAEPVASPPPVLGIAASPSPSPSASPPAGTVVTTPGAASPSSASAAPGASPDMASPSPGASPSPPAAGTGSQSGGTPAPVAAPSTPPASATAGSASPTPAPSGSPTTTGSLAPPTPTP